MEEKLQNKTFSSNNTENKKAKKTKENIYTLENNKYIFPFGERTYIIGNLDRNKLGSMKILLRVKFKGFFYDDTLDLYSAKNRKIFIIQCSEELELKNDNIKIDLSKILLELEDIQEELLSPKNNDKNKKIVLSPREEEEAMKLLKDKNLIKRIIRDIEKVGLVGEKANSLVCYLACVSRQLDNPLAVLIQSSSSGGKSTLMDIVLSFFPPEYVIKLSSLTPQSLYYMGEDKLKHKILCLMEEEGVETSSYPLKILQSEKYLEIATTGKDPKTGKLQTETYRVEGPVQIILTTTNPEVDEELENRCLVLSVNENRNQTRLIHQLQREAETLVGQLTKNNREKIKVIHRNALRLLESIIIVNPFAKGLKFTDNKLRSRRDHQKYLLLIKSITFLYQYQREKKTIKQGNKIIRYIETTKEDILIANKLCHLILGKSLDDLSPQTRRLLSLIYDYVKTKCQEEKTKQENFYFSRRER